MGYTATLTQAGWLINQLAPTLDFLSDAMPQPETSGAAGADQKAARGTHSHPRLTSSTRITLDGSGLATVTYTRSFAAKPAIVLTAINPSGRQVQLEVISDIQVGGLYTGCTLKGSRAALLPTLSVLLTELTKLSGFDVLGGSAAGVEVSVVAIQPSN